MKMRWVCNVLALACLVLSAFINAAEGQTKSSPTKRESAPVAPPADPFRGTWIMKVEGGESLRGTLEIRPSDQPHQYSATLETSGSGGWSQQRCKAFSGPNHALTINCSIDKSSPNYRPDNFDLSLVDGVLRGNLVSVGTYPVYFFRPGQAEPRPKTPAGIVAGKTYSMSGTEEWEDHKIARGDYGYYTLGIKCNSTWVGEEQVSFDRVARAGTMLFKASLVSRVTYFLWDEPNPAWGRKALGTIESQSPISDSVLASVLGHFDPRRHREFGSADLATWASKVCSDQNQVTKFAFKVVDVTSNDVTLERTEVEGVNPGRTDQRTYAIVGNGQYLRRALCFNVFSRRFPARYDEDQRCHSRLLQVR